MRQVYVTVAWLNAKAIEDGRTPVENIIDGTYCYDEWMALHLPGKAPKSPEVSAACCCRAPTPDARACRGHTHTRCVIGRRRATRV